MRKNMHFYRVVALAEADDENGNPLPASPVDLGALLTEIERRSKINTDLSTLTRRIGGDDFALSIYESDMDSFSGRFCIMQSGPMSEGVIKNEDGSKEIGEVHAANNVISRFKTIAFVYKRETNQIGLSMNCNQMVEKYLISLNNEADYGVESIIIKQEEVVRGIDSFQDTDFVNTVALEFTTTAAKNVKGDNWIADIVRGFASITSDTLISLKFSPEETAGGDRMLATKSVIGKFWEENHEILTSMDVNPGRKGGFRFGKQKHVREFEVSRNGDVIEIGELNKKALEYLNR